MLGVPLRHLLDHSGVLRGATTTGSALSATIRATTSTTSSTTSPCSGFVLFAMKRVQKAIWASKSYNRLGYL